MDDENNQFGQASSGNVFADNPQFSATFERYFNDHGSGTPVLNDAGWGVNTGNNSNYQSIAPSRAPPQITHTNAWQTASHLSASPAAPLPYGRSPLHSPSPYGQHVYGGNVGGQHQHPGQFQHQYDPSLIAPPASNSGYTTNYAAPHTQGPQGSSTISPQALDFDSQQGFGTGPQAPNNSYGVASYPPPRSAQVVDMRAVAASIPKSTEGGIFHVIDFSKLSDATKSDRIDHYLNIGKEPQEWPITRASLPNYVPRKSKNELRQLAGSNSALLAKLGKKPKQDARLHGQAAKPVHTSLAKKPVSAQSPSDSIKYEGNLSSSEEPSSSDDDSSYTSDDEDVEPAPLPSKRPDNPKDAVEYDTIKALWRSRRKTISNDSVKQGLVDFWEILKTVRNRWKSDKEAADAAEEKSKKSDPVLQGRVKDQRDMIEAAFKAALKHGHRSIVELLAENRPLVYLCYQFLLDRFKADDLNGPLSRAILETMSLFTTLTEDALEKTYMFKILPRFVKKGDARTQFYCKRISQNVAAASKDQKAETVSPSKPATAPKPAVAATTPAKKLRQAESVAGVKRTASNAGAGSVEKKLATGAATRPATTAATVKTNTVNTTKRPAVEASKSTPANGTTPLTKPKTITAKPSNSGFFSSLQSASKRPGTSISSKTGSAAVNFSSTGDKRLTVSAIPNAAPKSTFSFAETMANLTKMKEDKSTQKPEKSPEKELPPESPEEKAKRLRKESRRHLHVSFKPAEDLVQVRYFTHDPEEELGHDSSQMRDVSDVGGEGRMFKQQHQMMDIDEDDEAAGDEIIGAEWKEPSLIDLSVIDEQERKRNFSKFGGELEPDSPERAARDFYEANNLIVIYTDPADIPPNPRERPGLNDDSTSAAANAPVPFGEPPAHLADRARTKKQQVANQPVPFTHPPVVQQQQQQPQFDLAALLQNTQPQNQQAPQQPSQSDALLNILASLKQSQPQAQQQPVQPPTPSFVQPFSNVVQPNGLMAQPPAQQQPPAGQLDISAIMAALQNSQVHANAVGAGPSNPGFPPTVSIPQTANQHGGGLYEKLKQWRESGGDDVSKIRENNPRYKTKPCKYWRDGKCTRGSECNYLHEDD